MKDARDLRIEDLLNRKPVDFILEQVRERLHDRAVLVTGAGGSIGAELARQVATFQPQRLVLFDLSEDGLVTLRREFSNRFPDLKCSYAIGDVHDENRLREVFTRHRPHSVFHAAAYKHVSMMEENCCQAVMNNVLGTYNVAMVAEEYLADDFLLISTDKAVNPTSVMGVTKRIAELIVVALRSSKTRFTAVRFGNVLGSRGSVVPIFEEQIQNGGPVTVTHPEAARYFMTVTEAVQLVLLASSMGRGGEIFVLDMGEPEKILDLATRMIGRDRLDWTQDIPIVFTGLRPGEKLFEELSLEQEGIKATPHEKIHVLEGSAVEISEVRSWMEQLSLLVEWSNVQALVAKMKTIVPEYRPSTLIMAEQDGGAARKAGSVRAEVLGEARKSNH